MSRARDLGSLINSTAAGKNFIINGGFDFFQRGSLSTTTGGYGLDRWFQISSGSGSAVTITQQTTGVPSGSRYCGRITIVSGYGNQYQFIETSNVSSLWGKTVTASIKLRRSSAFVGTLSLGIAKSATVDGGNSASWSTISAITATNSQLPTGTTSSDWYTLSTTVVIPSDGTANSLRIAIEQSQGEVSAYWEMAQAQLEIGSSSTSFSRSGVDIQSELAKCQRYYYRAVSESPYGPIGTGKAYSSNILNINVPFPVKMRSIPSVTSGDLSALSTFQFETGASAGTTPTSIATNPNLNSSTYGSVDVTKSSAFTTGAFYYLMGLNNANSFIGFNAEL